MLRIAPFVLLLALAFAGCRTTSDAEKSDRWQPYPGCDANQCKSWYEACSAECIGKGNMTVTECENKCNAHRASCETSCGGGGAGGTP